MVNEWLIAIRARQPDWIEKRLIPRHDLTAPPPKQVRRAEARREIMSEIAPTPDMPRTHKNRRE